jgi:hypothetical protein
MSIDILTLTDELSFLIIGILDIFIVFRAAEIGRAFVNRIYRNRAFWIAATTVVVLVNDFVGHFPYAPLSNLSVFTFLLLFPVVFTFVDSTILATLEIDFFHRNTLRWRQFRLVAYIAVYGETAILFILIYTATFPNAPSWINAVLNSAAFDILFLIILFVFVYSVLAVIVGARRIQDRIMKRHLMLLGLAVALFIISIANDVTVAFSLIDDAISLIATYVIYRAVMTLSSVGHIERETK